MTARSVLVRLDGDSAAGWRNYGPTCRYGLRASGSIQLNLEPLPSLQVHLQWVDGIKPQHFLGRLWQQWCESAEPAPDCIYERVKWSDQGDASAHAVVTAPASVIWTSNVQRIS